MCGKMQQKHVARTIARLFETMRPQVITNLAEQRPEYAILAILHKRGTKPPYLALTAVTAALALYPASNEAKAWQALAEVAEKKDLNNVATIRELAAELLSQPALASYNKQRKTRIHRLYQSGYADWLGENYEEMRSEPAWMRRRLADSLRITLRHKAVAAAMKALDVAHLVSHGEHLPLPPALDPPDPGLKTLTISAGLLPTNAPNKAYTQIWTEILGQSPKLSSEISLPLLAAAMSQLGEAIAEAGFNPQESRRLIASRLEAAGANPEAADNLAKQLTKHADRTKP